MAWHWEFTVKSKAQFIKLESTTKKRILTKLDFWTSSGYPLQFSEHLTNFDAGQYRFRIGDYRIIFDVEDDTIIVIAIGHRRDIYT